MRLVILLTAAGLLTGCSSMMSKDENLTEIKMHTKSEDPERTHTYNIGWVRNDWSICEEGKTCLKPTPKTMIPPVSLSVVMLPKKENPEPKPAPKPDTKYIVNFPYRKAVPTKDGAAQLSKILREIRDNHVIHITGYTDNIGGEVYNELLAQRRAKFVATKLKNQGIRNPIELEAKGNCCYLATNETEDGRAANRRAEVVLLER